MGRVVHFEIHAEDPARARTFYEKVFAWKITQWQDQEYWLVMTGEDSDKGINGGITKRLGNAPTFDNPVSAFVCTIDVDDIDDVTKKVVEAGGNVVVEKRDISGTGWSCYCKDTEGNIFGLMQSKDKSE
jgi:uncharacterized protein